MGAKPSRRLMEIWGRSPYRRFTRDLSDLHSLKIKHFEAYLDLNFRFKAYSENS